MEEAKDQGVGSDAEMEEEDEEEAEDEDEEGQDEDDEEEADGEDEPMHPDSDESDGGELTRADMKALIALLHPASHAEQNSAASWLPIDRAAAAVGIEKGYISAWATRELICSLKPPGRNRRRLVSPNEIRGFLIKRMNKRHRVRLLNFMRRGRRMETMLQQHPKASTFPTADAVMPVVDVTIAEDAPQAGIEVRRMTSNEAEPFALPMVASTIDGDAFMLSLDPITSAL